MRRVTMVFLVLLATACQACSHKHFIKSSALFERYQVDYPTTSRFEICYSHDCESTASVALNDQEWKEIQELFSEAPPDPSSERLRIAKSIAKLEAIVGRKTGTSVDVGGTFSGLFTGYQLDCVDETVNTSVYLTLLLQNGLIRFHDLKGTATRGFFVMDWPHVAALIVDTTTEEQYVVDSWFSDNGMPAHVVPLDTWSQGWHPVSKAM